MADLEKKVKKEKAFTFGQLMKRWGQKIKDPFDSVLYGAKVVAYATHAVQTFRRQQSDYEKTIDAQIEPLEAEFEGYSEQLNPLREQSDDLYRAKKQDSPEYKVLEAQIAPLETARDKLSDRIYRLEDKKERGNGWSIGSGIFTVGALGGGYTAAGFAISTVAGPVGWAVFGVPVITQAVSHVAEALVKAKRELRAEYEESKEE